MPIKIVGKNYTRNSQHVRCRYNFDGFFNAGLTSKNEDFLNLLIRLIRARNVETKGALTICKLFGLLAFGDCFHRTFSFYREEIASNVLKYHLSYRSGLLAISFNGHTEMF